MIIRRRLLQRAFYFFDKWDKKRKKKLTKNTQCDQRNTEMKYYFLRVGFTHKILKKELLQYIRYQLIHSYSYFQIQDLIGFCHQNFIILLNSHKPILIVHASALLYITPDYMKPAEMISMSFFRNWIKTGKKIEAKKMMKE